MRTTTRLCKGKTMSHLGQESETEVLLSGQGKARHYLGPDVRVVSLAIAVAVAIAVACDVSFDSNSGVQMACTGPEYSALHLQVLFLLVHWQCPPASAPTATRFNSYARPPHPAQACWPTSTASRPALAIVLIHWAATRRGMLKIVACRAAARPPTFAARPPPLLRSRQRVRKARYVALPTLEILEIAVHAMMGIMMLRISRQR